ncbi:MAG: alpha/beta hydrolase [Clostridiales bacterium]|nr:alpha/beta hydrolase [Clostridiales bacterium]
MKKKLIIAASVIVALALVITVVGGNILYMFALKPGGMMRFVDGSKILEADESVERTNLDIPFAQNGTREDYEKNAQVRTLTSYDGLKLNAYYREATAASHKYAVICHGYTSRAIDMGVFGDKFRERGFNVLMPDARGHGNSEGDYIGMGWHERRDITDWINTLVEQDPAAQIILMGVSMGGATVMMTSGEELPDNVKLVIDDCGYSSVWDEFAFQMGAMFHLPTFPLLNMADAVCRIRAGYNFKEASAVEQVKKCKIPTLFIHGEEDTFVPYEMVHKVYEAATCEKYLFTVHGAGHGMSAAVDPTGYWNAIDTAIAKNVK